MIMVYPIQPITGTVNAIPPSAPASIVNNNQCFDDDGHPYVNPNVPGADIATGDKQTQILSALFAPQVGSPGTELEFAL